MHLTEQSITTLICLGALVGLIVIAEVIGWLRERWIMREHQKHAPWGKEEYIRRGEKPRQKLIATWYEMSDPVQAVEWEAVEAERKQKLAEKDAGEQGNDESS